ncbi:hypothetical protein STRDD11_01396 [Streptococcus sp. DD11]|uniref:hypothetical protein n=1 Tax=Streptococcus sp. DD11 TaxID=1777879 RepID=UPI000791E240|nr:hypothetical protein [Streptococcus sp. DD11]KXT83617.1 hypothetical protein STRDD11_01396 [Streptococcus sp. DD11]
MINLPQAILFIVLKYMSFYATVLSITFTIYSFQNAQKQRDEDFKREQAKLNEAKLDELEARKDKYRPTFIVEKDNLNGGECVKLLMRENDLYLEDIVYYDSPDNLNSTVVHPNLKSGSRIARKRNTSFYILAKTQVGETILFGYLNGGIKVYKYLKKNGNALIPRGGYSTYSQEIVNQNWGDYNTVAENSNALLDQVFFYNTLGIREKIIFSYFASIERTLEATSAELFFQSVFYEIQEGIEPASFTLDSIHEVTQKLLDSINDNIENFSFLDFNNNLNYNYLRKQEKMINNQGSIVQSYFTVNSSDLDFERYIDFQATTLRNLNNNQKVKYVYKGIVTIITEIFKFVKVDTCLDDKTICYKKDVFNDLKFRG